MKSYTIEWTQTIDGVERRHTEKISAGTACIALVKWQAKNYINAKVDAVYDAERFTAAGRDGDAEPKADWLELPRDIKLQRFVASDRSVTFMGQYHCPATAAKTNAARCRVYRVEVRPLAPIEGGWCVAIFEDNKRVWRGAATTCRYVAEITAVKMLKCYLARKVRNCIKRGGAKAHKAEGGAA